MSLTEYIFSDFKFGGFPHDKGRSVVISFDLFDGKKLTEVTEDRLLDCIVTVSQGFIAPHRETVPSLIAVLGLGEPTDDMSALRKLDERIVDLEFDDNHSSLYFLLYPKQGEQSDTLLSKILKSCGPVKPKVYVFRGSSPEKDHYKYTGEVYQ